MSVTTLKTETITRDADTKMLLEQIIDRVDTLAIQQSRPSPVKLTTWNDIERFAEKAARSGMVPKDYIGKPDAIAIAVQMGSELGLPPMQAIQNIAVINGRPSVWGDAMPGLIRASGKCAYIKEWSEGDGEDLTFYIETRRKDDPTPVSGKFSVADAKRAQLWGKDLYAKYPQRMLKMRARGFALRDAFPDVLRGLISAEEAMDMAPDPFQMPGTPLTAAQAIGDDTPDHVQNAAPKPPQRTRKQFLNDLEQQLTDAVAIADPDARRKAVDAILGHPDTKRAEDVFENGDKARLDGLIQTAIAQLAGPEAQAAE